MGCVLECGVKSTPVCIWETSLMLTTELPTKLNFLVSTLKDLSGLSGCNSLFDDF